MTEDTIKGTSTEGKQLMPDLDMSTRRPSETEAPKKRERKAKAVPVDDGSKGINVAIGQPTVEELLTVVEKTGFRLPRNKESALQRTLWYSEEKGLSLGRWPTPCIEVLPATLLAVMHAKRSASAAKAQRRKGKSKGKHAQEQRTRADIHRDVDAIEREMVALHKRHERLLAEYVAMGRKR